MTDAANAQLDDLLLASGPEGRARYFLRALARRLAQAHTTPSVRVLAAPLVGGGPLPFSDIDRLHRLIRDSQAHGLECDRTEFTENGLVGQYADFFSIAVERSGAVGVAIACSEGPESLVVGGEHLHRAQAFFGTLGALKAGIPALQEAAWLVRLMVDEPENATIRMRANQRTVSRSPYSATAFEDFWPANETAQAVGDRVAERLAGVFGLRSATPR